MRPLLSLLLLATLPLAPALAQPEDAAHRADRLATQRLNSRSFNGYPASRRAGRHAAQPRDAGADAAYARARTDYQARLADWRRRVAACENGQWSACDNGGDPPN